MAVLLTNKKISIKDEMEACSDIINKTWGAEDESTRARIALLVSDAFEAVSQCKEHLFGSKTLMNELLEIKKSRYLFLKKDFMALLLKEFDGQHQLITAVISGLNKANKYLNANLSKFHNYNEQIVINQLTEKYSYLEIEPVFESTDSIFKGHDFEAVSSLKYKDHISFDNVMTSLDITNNTQFLVEATLTQAKLAFSHNLAVDIIDNILATNTPKFRLFPNKNDLSAPTKFLVSISGHDLLELDPVRNKSVYDRLVNLSLDEGPFINDINSMKSLLNYKEHMPVMS
ncbi:hypothetical protein [Psychromonas sp. SP041]|uniref:hypothetical protein n=1 Tax=Psychromonas sp. SP041 TaxID=1365007 RepID=UPI0010C77407|nr:hypothetical protein [Psychromonas sp. SP041]